MFKPSYAVQWNQLRPVGLAVLSTDLPHAFSGARPDILQQKTGSLQFMGNEIVYFGIPKHHSVQGEAQEHRSTLAVSPWGLTGFQISPS